MSIIGQLFQRHLLLIAPSSYSARKIWILPHSPAAWLGMAIAHSAFALCPSLWSWIGEDQAQKAGFGLPGPRFPLPQRRPDRLRN